MSDDVESAEALAERFHNDFYPLPPNAEGALKKLIEARDRLIREAAAKEAAKREQERCVSELRKHYRDYEKALANPRDREFDQGYLSGACNAIFCVEELPDEEPSK